VKDNNQKSQSPIEKRINVLVKECEGIPPGEIMKLLMKADRNPAFDVESELANLRAQYKTMK
jgi:hypothetical protein